MQGLLNELGINEKLTKGPKKQKVFNHVKDNIPLVEDYNTFKLIYCFYLPLSMDINTY